MFKKNNENKEEVKVDQDSINGKFSREISELRETVSRLDAELFAIKSPNGKLELSYPNFTMSYNRHLWFTYSNGCKIRKIDIDSLSYNFSFYKVQICNDKAYIGIKFGKDNDVEESYYIVDMNRNTVIEIESNSFEKFDSIEWNKNE